MRAWYATECAVPVSVRTSRILQDVDYHYTDMDICRCTHSVNGYLNKTHRVLRTPLRHSEVPVLAVMTKRR